ncbi:DASH complex subunit Ask1-domain-containing protein [Cunninghamella echinulata]|nr:DASH complex subunit Ask1-domain-containing protein [Cunninghamella echinulata]
MSMTDEEINEKLEKVQQHITLTLQAIDLNFARCNQIVSASMLPTVDKYNEATREIWNNSKIWNYLFKSLDHTNNVEHGSNRPPLSPLTSTHSHDMLNKSTLQLQLLQSHFNTSFGTSELSSLSSKDEKMSD